MLHRNRNDGSSSGASALLLFTQLTWRMRKHRRHRVCTSHTQPREESRIIYLNLFTNIPLYNLKQILRTCALLSLNVDIIFVLFLCGVSHELAQICSRKNFFCDLNILSSSSGPIPLLVMFYGENIEASLPVKYYSARFSLYKCTALVSSFFVCRRTSVCWRMPESDLSVIK